MAISETLPESQLRGAPQPGHSAVIIPALNEEKTIAGVVRSIPPECVHEIIVVDNGSTDQTAKHAQEAGARVVSEPRRGYGKACRAGVNALSSDVNIVIFMDGDGSDCPELMARLVDPILAGTHDFAIGSRTRGNREVGSMNPQQVFAARLMGFLIRLLYGIQYTDMCPFRAIRRDSLDQLGLRSATYGWNLEMQMRAAQIGLRIVEVPVDHRCRAGGQSKVSGTFKGTVLAGLRILATFMKIAWRGRAARKNTPPVAMQSSSER
jgi:glycosyltransferase involved in cell wall biosynthesis